MIRRRFPALFVGACLAGMAAVGLIVLKDQGYLFAERCPDGARGTVLRDWASTGLAAEIESADLAAARALAGADIKTREPRFSVAEAFPTATCEGVVIASTGMSVGPGEVDRVAIGRFVDADSAQANLHDTGIAARSDVSMQRIDERTIVFSPEETTWLVHARGCVIVEVTALSLSTDRVQDLAELVGQAAAGAVCGEA